MDTEVKPFSSPKCKATFQRFAESSTHYCTQCRSMQPSEGGRWVPYNGNRNRRWQCKLCREHKSKGVVK